MKEISDLGMEMGSGKGLIKKKGEGNRGEDGDNCGGCGRGYTKAEHREEIIGNDEAS